jgi:hypothetical protein
VIKSQKNQTNNPPFSFKTDWIIDPHDGDFNEFNNLPIASAELVFSGGTRPPEHIAAQERLEAIFYNRGFITKQEDPVWCFNEVDELKEYQVDVMVMTKKSYNLVGLEVDNFGSDPVNKKIKHKSPAVMKERDQLISRTYKIPIVRFDIDCLKDGRKKTKFYMSDPEIYAAVMGECLKFYKDHAIRYESGKLINIE